MSRIATIRRRLLLCAGSLLVLSGLSLTVVHAGVVRRFVLVQMQIRLGNAVGLVIDAKNLDYNLFHSRFELRDITLKGTGLADLPAPVKVQRVELVLPVWRLIRGSFDTARIRIDGLSVHWFTARDGRNNWPSLSGLEAGGTAGGGPAVLVTGGDFSWDDEKNGILVQLPVREITGAWNASSSQYRVACESAATGWLQWKGVRRPLEAHIRGSLAGSPARIDAAADLNLDLHDFTEARGRLEARVLAAGTLDAIQLTSAVRGEDLLIGGTAVRRPVLEASYDTRGGDVLIRSFSAGVFGGQITSFGRLHIGEDPGRSELTASLSGANLPTGRTAVDFIASWPGLDFHLATVSGVARCRSDKVAFTATGQPDSVQVTLDSTVAGLWMHGDIGFGLDNHAISGTVHGTAESLAPLARRLNLPAIDGNARWSATLGGTTKRPTASVQLDAGGLSAGNWTGAGLHVQADYAGHRIGINQARLTWEGHEIEAKGELGGTSPDAPLQLDGTVAVQSLAGVFRNLEITAPVETALSGAFHLSGSLAHPVVETTLHTVHSLTVDTRATGGAMLTGMFQIEARGEGSLSDPVFSARLNGSEVKVNERAIGDLRATIDAANRRANAMLAVPALNVQATSTIALEGAWPFEIALDARSTQLPEASLDADVHANGTLSPAQLGRASAAIRNLRITAQGQEIVGDGPIELSYADGCLDVNKLALKSGNSAIRASGEMPLEDEAPAGSLSVEGRLDLAQIPQSLVSGVAEVTGSITGSLRHWQPAASVTIHDAAFHAPSLPVPIENINGKLELRDGVIRAGGIDATVGGGAVRMDGSVPLRLISETLPPPSADPTQPAKFSAQIAKMQLSGGTGDQAVTATLAAKLEGEASSLSLPAVRATLEFTQLEATTKRNSIRQNGPTRVTITGGVARIEQFEIGTQEASLRATGAMGLAEPFPLELEAEGQANLAFLSVLSAPLEASGTAKLDLRVGGTLSAPSTTGFIEMENGSLLLPDPRIRASDVKLRADLNGDQVTVTELTGVLNGGAFKGGGDLIAGTGGLRDVNLFLKGQNTFTEFPASVKTTSALDMQFVSDGDRLVLKGQIEVQDGYIDSAIDLFSRRENMLDIGPEGPPEPNASPVSLDIKIVTKRPVEMDNNLGRIAGTANLRLSGTVKKTGLQGALDLEQDGKIYFGDRIYYIDRGTIRFVDEYQVTPELNIRAYTRTSDYTIYLGITGQPDEITTTFTSDPPLSRDDVIAVLLTGKTVADNPGVDIRALEATSLAAGAMNAALSSELHRALGVSRVSIQPGAVAAESNNPGTRITITQDFTSAMRLLYSMNLSDSNDQIWVGEYDLSRRFTTRAVKQSDNTYRGEFRHDIRFGSSSPSAAAPARTANRKISQLHFTGTGPFTPEDLARVFKVKQGQTYKAPKVRKRADRLTKFLTKKGYLENRVRLDREDEGNDIALTVRIELGPTVDLAYNGASLPKKQKSRLRTVWHAGISDQQRPQASREAILGYYFRKGFFEAKADVHAATAEGHKTVSFDLQPGPRYRGVKIVVEGAERQRAKEILALVEKQPMKTAVYRNPGTAAEAITRYYQQRGYLAAKVAPPLQRLDNERRTGRVVIAIEEGPLFHAGTIEFSGNRALTADELRSGTPLDAGAVFEPARLDPTVAAIKLKYGKLGYRDPRIEFALARHDDSATVDVAFTIVENQQTSIGSIAVEGNRRTSEQYVRRRVEVAPGGVANSESIRASLKNLSQTGAYASTDIQVRPPVQTTAVDKPIQPADLVVAVTEPKPYRLLYGGLYDSGNGPGFILDFQNLNTLGAGRTLGLRTRYDSETNEARLYVTQPTWGLRRLSTTVAAYYTRQEEYLQTTPTDKLGVSLQQDLHLRSKWMLTYGYRYEKQKGFVPDPASPPIPQTVVTVSPVLVTLSRDARDSFLDATRGSFISHAFEYAPRILGSDYPYARYYVQYFKYFPLTRPRPVPFGEKEQRSRLVFATGSRLGLQKGFTETGAVLTDRFYAGGGTTVRGFHQDELGPRLASGLPAGGNAVLVLNEELRYPLFWIFDAVTFVDIGNVYPRVTDFRLSDLRAASGFGLRLRNPFVVLRFDYGFKLGRRPGESIGAFFFSIGQAF